MSRKILSHPLRRHRLRLRDMDELNTPLQEVIRNTSGTTAPVHMGHYAQMTGRIAHTPLTIYAMRDCEPETMSPGVVSLLPSWLSVQMNGLQFSRCSILTHCLLEICPVLGLLYSHYKPVWMRVVYDISLTSFNTLRAPSPLPFSLSH